MIERLNKGSQGLQIRMNFSELFQTGVDFFILGIIWHFFPEKYLQKTQKNTLQIMFWIENYTPSPPGPFSLKKLIKIHPNLRVLASLNMTTQKSQLGT